MRRILTLLAVLVPATVGAQAGGFDGRWTATLSCAPAAGALGYSYRFPVVVQGSVLHGSHGTSGQPGFLEFDGSIGADGTGQIYAHGLTGASAFVPGGDVPRGTEYGYHLDVRLSGASGTGTRVEGRPCTMAFMRT